MNLKEKKTLCVWNVACFSFFLRHSINRTWTRKQASLCFLPDLSDMKCQVDKSGLSNKSALQTDATTGKIEVMRANLITVSGYPRMSLAHVIIFPSKICVFDTIFFLL